MKLLLLLAFLLPLAGFTQTIQSDFVNDKGTARRIATSRLTFNGYTSSLAGTVSIQEHDTVLRMNFFFLSTQATYTDETTVAILKLDNGSMLKVQNEGGFKQLEEGQTGFFVFSLTGVAKTALLNHRVVGYIIETENLQLKTLLSGPQQEGFLQTIRLLESQARSATIPDSDDEAGK